MTLVRNVGEWTYEMPTWWSLSVTQDVLQSKEK